MRASELYSALCALDEFRDVNGASWWPDYGSFWVVIDSVLCQNTKFENALKARKNLENFGVKSLEDVAKIPVNELAILIKPAGFYNTKAKRLNELCKGICADFGDFENFKENVSKEWLILRKGLGLESVYSVLCNACKRAYMVYDKYTYHLLLALNYEFDDYDEAREFLEGALEVDNGLSDELKCAHFHALITEFCKAHLKGKVFDEKANEFFKIFL